MNTAVLSKSIYTLACLLVILGFTVLIGWYTKNTLLIQILPSFVPMQYNTALGFVLGGMGLVFLTRPQSSQLFLMICGFLLVTLGVITELQYLFHWNSGLDELFMKHDITVKTSSPGRMAPNTALCFLLLGILYLLDSLWLRCNQPNEIRHLYWFGSAVLVLGGIAIIGYLTNMQSAWGWSHFSRMALHTSVGFTIMGSAILITAIYRSGDKKNSIHKITLTVSLMLALGMTFFTYQFLKNEQFERNIQLTQTQLNIIASEVGTNLKATRSSLNRMLERNANQFNSKDLLFDAHAYLKDFPRLQYIELFGATNSKTDFQIKRNETLSHTETTLLAQLKRALKNEHNIQPSINHKTVISVLSDQVGISLSVSDTKKMANTNINMPHLLAIIDYRKLLKDVPEVKNFQEKYRSIVSIYLQDEFQLSDSLRAVPIVSHVPFESEIFTLSTTVKLEDMSSLNVKSKTIVFLNALFMFSFIWAYRSRTLFKHMADYLSVIQNGASTGLITVDLEGIIKSANQSVLNIFGWLPKELIGQPITTLIASSLHAKHPIWLNEFVKKQEKRKMGFSDSIKGLHKNGHFVPLNISLEFTNTPDGQQVLASIIDLSEIQTLENNLDLEKNRLQNILDNVGNGIWELDPTGNAVYVNSAACDMLGYSAEELINHQMHMMVHHSHEDGTPYPPEQCPMRATTTRGETHSVDTEVFWRKDGTSFPIVYVVTPLPYADGRKGAVVVFYDVSEQKRLQSIQTEYTKKLKTINQEMEEFSYVASHDLQEPLRTIHSFTSFLKDDIGRDIPEAAANDIQFIQHAVNRMSLLINDLLDLSRTGNVILKMGPVDLQQSIKTITEDLYELIHNSNTKITVDHLPVVFADQTQIQRVLQNLIQNAIKFRTNTSPEIHIYIKEQNEFTCTIAVKDNGIGIEPKYQEQIFHPFKRLHGMDEYAGCGIGLSVVKKIVDRHNGRISIESEKGKGSIFSIELPIYNANER